MKVSEFHPSCFDGMFPSTLTTIDEDGGPHTIQLSKLTLVDDGHVATSRQFLRTTARNLDRNPRACITVIDPRNLCAHLLDVEYLRTETTGPLFDEMNARVEAIASMCGMTGVFRLLGADIFRVLQISAVAGSVVDGGLVVKP